MRENLSLALITWIQQIYVFTLKPNDPIILLYKIFVQLKFEHHIWIF